MSLYEQMKNQFLYEIDMLGIDKKLMPVIGSVLDKVAYGYDIKAKETAMTIVESYIPMLLKTYIAVKKTEGLADGTLTNYMHVLKLFFLWTKKRPEDVTANDIRMFLYNYQTAKKISSRTLDKYREMISWFFSWAYTEEYIPRNPAKSVKAIKHEIKERQALTQIELEYLRKSCKTPRDRAMIEFFYSTGCRVSELTGVKKNDIDWKQNTVHLFGKNKKHRTSFINAKCEVALLEYLNSRKDDNEYLFVGERKPHNQMTKCAVEAAVKKIADKTKIVKHITPHVLRHTTATQAVNSGMPIENVSKLLGHSSVNTTMIYAKVSQTAVHSHHTRCIV